MLWRQARQLQTVLLFGILSLSCVAVRTSIVARTTPAERPGATPFQPGKCSLLSAENVVSGKEEKERKKKKNVLR